MENNNGGVPRLKSLDDYYSWKDEFKNAMMAKGKVWICIEEGTAAGMMAASSKNKEDWIEAEIKAKGHILEALGPIYRTVVKSSKTPKDMWEKLQSAFEERVSLKLELLEVDFNTIKQKDGESIDTFASRIEKLAEQLDMAGRNIEVARRMKALTQGLRPEFAVWKAMLQHESDMYAKFTKRVIKYKGENDTEIELTPQVDKIDELERYQDALTQLRAREEEIKRTTSVKTINRHMAMSTQQQQHRPNKNNNNNFNRPMTRCIKCGRNGHIARVCGVRCTNCQRLGHYANECKSTSISRQEPPRQSNLKKTPQRNHATARVATTVITQEEEVTKPQENQQNENEPQFFTQGRAMTAEVLNCDFINKIEADAQLSPDTTERWILDSGASSHMTNKIEYFSTLDLKDTKMKIKTATGQVIDVEGIGEVNFTPLINNEEGEVVTFKNVLYAPKLDTNLLSMTTIMQNGEIVFNKQDKDAYATIIQEGEVALQCELYNNTMFLKGTTNKPIEFANVTTVSDDDLLAWHNRLGHANIQAVREALELANGTKIKRCRIQCEVCEAGKATRLPFDTSHSKTTKQLEIIHSDVMGPFDESTEGYKYVVTFIDDFSRHTTVIGLFQKGEVPQMFRQYLETMEARTNRRIQHLMSDNGGEFVNRVLEDYMGSRGITHRRTVPYTPQQNGIAERMNRTLMDMVRCMLIQSGLPDEFWFHALSHATNVRNRIPNTSTTKAKSPYELFYDKKADISFLKPFGCAAWVHIPQQRRRGKLGPRSDKMIHLGSSLHSKAYEFVNFKYTRIELSRDATFVENKFPVKPLQVRQRLSQPSQRRIERIDQEESEDEIDILSLATTASSTLDMLDPVSIREAQARPDWPQWEKAMESELASHKENGTWEVADDATGHGHMVDCKWVYKLKLKPDGSVDKYKARLVARGFTQREGIDYEETFAPVLKFSTLRILIALATSLNLQMEQMDVVTAFLNGVLDEVIYMKPPPGYWEGRKLKLKKALYGLKQAGRKWYEKLDEKLNELGFKRIQSDFGVYTKGELPNSLCTIAVYVDDIVILSSTAAIMDSCKRDLTKAFKMTDGGKIK